MFGLLAAFSTASANIDSVSSFTLSVVNSDSASIFMKTANPGDELKVKVRISNISDKDKEFTLYATDVLPTLRGGWSYPLKDKKPTLFGTWAQEKPVKETLKSHKSKDFVFTFRVPVDIADGQYIAAIASQEFTPYFNGSTSTGMSTQTDADTQIGLQVVFNVNKDNATHKVEIGELSHIINNTGLVTIYLPHVNQGTILEKPKGSLTLRDKDNKLILTEPYAMKSVYVGTTGLYDFNLPNMLVPGTYKLDYTTSYGAETLTGKYTFQITASDLMNAMNKADNTGADYDLGFWAFLKEFWVWIIVVIAIIVILLIVIIILLFRRRREKDESKESVKEIT
jgi:hypothetical protein